MVISCLGDSLTEGDYGVYGKRGIGNVQEKSYPYFLKDFLCCEVRNFGKCGADPKSYLELLQSGVYDISGSDVIIIMLGTNGGLDKENSALEGNRSYDSIIAYCRKNAPRASIVLCTPPHATENPEFSNCGYAPQVKKAVEFVREYAEDMHMSLIDLASCPDFTAENEKIMQPNDGLHFGEEGYKTMARFIASELMSL